MSKKEKKYITKNIQKNRHLKVNHKKYKSQIHINKKKITKKIYMIKKKQKE